MGIFQTDPAYGKNLYRLNAMVELYVPVIPNTSVIPEKGTPSIAAIDGVLYFFNGTSWEEVGSDSIDAILNQMATNQPANFRISGTGEFNDDTNYAKFGANESQFNNGYKFLTDDDRFGIILSDLDPVTGDGRVGVTVTSNEEKPANTAAFFQIDGSLGLKAATDPLTGLSSMSENDCILIIQDTTDRTLILPSLSGFQRTVYWIKKAAEGGILTLQATGTDTINGASTYEISEVGAVVQIVGFENNWEIISSYNINLILNDESIIISAMWDGQTYYDYPVLAGKRYRLIRNGVFMEQNIKWTPIETGGWQLLLDGDILETGQIFTIQYY